MRDFSKWVRQQKNDRIRMRRKKISRKLREEVFAAKGTTCSYCGTLEVRALDHVVPCELGGKTSFENLVPCCDSCNSSKGHRLLEDWRMAA